MGTRVSRLLLTRKRHHSREFPLKSKGFSFYGKGSTRSISRELRFIFARVGGGYMFLIFGLRSLLQPIILCHTNG